NELLRAEQVIRPTGLLDPEVEVRPVQGQIDDLVGEVNKEVAKKNKILITNKSPKTNLCFFIKTLLLKQRLYLIIALRKTNNNNSY
ncbi:MAG: hypothetical protein RSE91_04705, partial [Bacilli bacterium]